MPRKSTPRPKLAKTPGNLAHAAEFRRRLLRWFRRHGRDLPWRRTRDPYRVLVSEFTIEWTMIDGVNDTQDQAAKLADIARRLRAHVNLIPLNATPLSADQPSPKDRIRPFIGLLRMRGVTVTLRDTRGKDIDAACGQLRVRAAST